MKVEIKLGFLLVNGRMCTTHKAITPFRTLVKRHKDLIEQDLDQVRVKTVSVMYLGTEHDDIFTPSGMQLLKLNKFNLQAIKKQHIRRSLHPFWEAIMHAGFKASVATGTMGSYTGFFLNASK